MNEWIFSVKSCNWCVNMANVGDHLNFVTNGKDQNIRFKKRDYCLSVRGRAANGNIEFWMALMTSAAFLGACNESDPCPGESDPCPGVFRSRGGSPFASSPPVSAKGCIKGAIIGGVAGHYAGHHRLLGAGAGCVIGHHEATKHARERERTYHEGYGNSASPGDRGYGPR
jgi:hypothetical protein